MSKNVTRLFRQFAPEHYTLHIEISEDKKSFNGAVQIKGRKVGRPSERITLHQKDLNITKAAIQHTDKKGTTSDVVLSRINTQKSFDEVRLHAEQTIYPGEYTIDLAFEGVMTRNMDGIYPCFFTHEGVEKQLIATQFESHHAREAFPCIDEPEAKATFAFSLTHDADETALSNTPIKEALNVKGQDARKMTVFEDTPIMSTYLLAFVVGDLRYKEATSKNNIRIRAYATPDMVEKTTFALDVAVKAMDFYEDYYDIPFPLEKCDFVALPDFASGAMENWGLITFREQTLLVDEHTSLGTKQYVAIVVAHELTHQWFGNLVTMRWWTDLWLNEGFASWMEYLAVDALFPEWQVWQQFAVDDQQAALKSDALEHTHPVEVQVNHPDEIRTIFDNISYQKGASVIHMLHDYLGPEPFRDGLRHYLKTHSYKNTDTIDLWQALEDVTGKPVRSFMGSWTSQSGFPIVTVEQKDDHLELTQQRFVANPSSTAREDAALWPVPLLAEGLDRPLFDKKKANIPVTGNTPIKLNSRQTGFYRVRYSETLQARQRATLDDNTLSDADRMGLLADSLEVTKAGYQTVNEYLDLLAHFSKENSLPVWEIMAGSLSGIRHTLSKSDTDDSLREAMKPFLLTLTQVQRARLGLDEKDGEPHLDTLLRPIIYAMSASADEQDALTYANEQFAKRMRGKTINADLRGTTYVTQARLKGESIYDELLQLYKETSSSDEKLSITAAMTSFETPELHMKALEHVTNGTVKLQDTGYWIAYGMMNRHARQESWQWIQDNWQWFKTHTGTDLSFSRTPVYVARSITDDTMLEEYKKFFTDRMEPMLERSFNQGLEIAQTATAWRTRDSENALVWFSKQSL